VVTSHFGDDGEAGVKIVEIDLFLFQIRDMKGGVNRARY
jgi:hypothetical protein